MLKNFKVVIHRAQQTIMQTSHNLTNKKYWKKAEQVR